LVRVQTTWTGVAGSPYYTNLYAIGPLATNNGNDLAAAWRTCLVAMTSFLTTGMVATIDQELLEFDETTGVVTGAGTTTQPTVTFTGTGDALPRSTQLLVRYTTAGIVHNRRVKGRLNIPGQTESNNNGDGTPGAALTTAVGVAFGAMFTTMSGRQRIWSQPLANDPPSPTNPNRPGSAWAVSGVSVSPTWAILRSRRD
jgi:hypothetical protein